jgi:hypothetical protein
MIFNFDYHPYIAIIADIKNSKRVNNRNDLQNKLKNVIEGINSKYKNDLASLFTITLGDEFQGLLKNGKPLVYIIDQFEREMYPIKIRFGVGIGEITTDIDYKMSLGADGPAYYNARSMIEEIKFSEKKHKELKINTKLSVQENPEASEFFNSFFSLLTIAKEKWTPRRVEIITTYITCNGTQEDAAKLLGINQSNIQKALASSNFYTYYKVLEYLSKQLSSIGENHNG